MSSCVRLVYFQCLVGLRLSTASGKSYELGVNGEKKLMETGILLIKNGHSTFHTGKSGNFGAIARSYSPPL